MVLKYVLSSTAQDAATVLDFCPAAGFGWRVVEFAGAPAATSIRQNDDSRQATKGPRKDLGSDMFTRFSAVRKAHEKISIRTSSGCFSAARKAPEKISTRASFGDSGRQGQLLPKRTRLKHLR